jgi:cell division protein FtsB
MAQDWRTLKLEILAETKQFLEGMNKSQKQTETFGDKLADFGKKAALAFAAAGAAATAFAIQAVKNAAADEAAQRKLEETIRASTKATADQVAAVGAYIDKTSIAIGVTDDELRPSLARLVRSTNDVEKAQNLLNLALDISAATGKPLQTVADGLGKAYDGNTASLGRLGLGIDQNLIKSKDFNAIYQTLTKTFGNFAENEALTTEKQFARIQIAVDEAKESIGAALLPVVDRLATFILTTLVPALQSFVAGLVGQKGVEAGVTEATQGAYQFGEQLRSTIKFVISIKDELIVLGGVIATVFVANKIVAFVTAIGTLVAAMKALRTAAAGAAVATAFATGGTSVGAAALALTAVAATYGLSQFATGADETGAGGSTFTYGTGNPQFGLPTGGGGGGGFAGGVFGGGATVGGGGGIITTPAGATSLKNLADRLTGIQDQFSELTFQVATGGIGKAAAQRQFDTLTREFKVLERQAETLASQEAARNFNPLSGITNNYYISGAVVDPEGLNRVITDASTQSAARGTTVYGRAGGL